MFASRVTSFVVFLIVIVYTESAEVSKNNSSNKPNKKNENTKEFLASAESINALAAHASTLKDENLSETEQKTMKSDAAKRYLKYLEAIEDLPDGMDEQLEAKLRDKRTLGAFIIGFGDLFGYDVQRRPSLLPIGGPPPAAAPAPAPAAAPAAAAAPAGGAPAAQALLENDRNIISLGVNIQSRSRQQQQPLQQVNIRPATPAPAVPVGQPAAAQLTVPLPLQLYVQRTPAPLIRKQIQRRQQAIVEDDDDYNESDDYEENETKKRFIINVPEEDGNHESESKQQVIKQNKKNFKKQFNKFWRKPNAEPEAHGYKYISPTPISSLQKDIDKELKRNPKHREENYAKHHKSVRSTDNPTLLHHNDQISSQPQSSEKHVQEIIPDSEAQPNHLAARIFHQALDDYFKQKNQRDLATQQNYLASVAINKELGKYFTQKTKNDAIRAKNAIQNPELVGQYYPKDDHDSKHETYYSFKEDDQPELQKEEEVPKQNEKVIVEEGDEEEVNTEANTKASSKEAEELLRLAEKLIRDRDNKKKNAPSNSIQENSNSEEEAHEDDNESEGAPSPESEENTEVKKTPVSEPKIPKFQIPTFDFEIGNDIELPSFPTKLQSDSDHKQEVVRLLQEADDITNQKHESESKRNEELKEIENLIETKQGKIETEPEEENDKDVGEEHALKPSGKAKQALQDDEGTSIDEEKDIESEDEEVEDEETAVKNSVESKEGANEEKESKTGAESEIESGKKSPESEADEESEEESKTQEMSKKENTEEPLHINKEKSKIEGEQAEEDQDQFYYEYFAEPSKETRELEEKIKEESGINKKIEEAPLLYLQEETFEEALKKNRPLESASLVKEGVSEENPENSEKLGVAIEENDEQSQENSEKPGIISDEYSNSSLENNDGEHSENEEKSESNKKDTLEAADAEEKEPEADQEANCENREGEEHDSNESTDQQEVIEDDSGDALEQNEDTDPQNEDKSSSKQIVVELEETQANNQNVKKTETDREGAQGSQQESGSPDKIDESVSYNTNPDAEKIIDAFVKENFKIAKVDDELPASTKENEEKKEFEYGNFDLEYEYPFEKIEDYWKKNLNDNLDKYGNTLEEDEESEEIEDGEEAPEEDAEYEDEDGRNVEKNIENEEKKLPKTNEENDELKSPQENRSEEKRTNFRQKNNEENDELKYPHESKSKEIYTKFRQKLATEADSETNQKPEDTKNIEVIQQEIYSPTLGPSANLDSNAKFSSVPFDFDYSSSEQKVKIEKLSNQNSSDVTENTNNVNLKHQTNIQQSPNPTQASSDANTFHSRFKRNIRENWSKPYAKGLRNAPIPTVASYVMPRRLSRQTYPLIPEGRTAAQTNENVMDTINSFQHRLKREIEEGWYKPESYDPTPNFYEIPQSEYQLDLRKLETKDFEESKLSPSAIVYENQTGRRKAVVRIKQNVTDSY